MASNASRAFLCVVLSVLCACASAPSSQTQASQCQAIPIEDAKTLIGSGRVEGVFQPHVGPVTLLLNDGSARCFEQPHLDWILIHLREQGLEDKITATIE